MSLPDYEPLICRWWTSRGSGTDLILCRSQIMNHLFVGGGLAGVRDRI